MILPQTRLGLLAVVLFLSASGAGADVVRMTTNYYKVYGATPREIRTSMARSKPWKDNRPMDARTDWRVRAKYSVADVGGVGRLQAFETETIITITMPVWSPPSGAPESLTNRWQKYFTALLCHEAGHAATALKAAAEVLRRAGAIREAPTSQELTRKLGETVDAVLKEFRAKEEEYDKETRHGLEQGAHFP